jgi:hypothetical protein
LIDEAELKVLTESTPVSDAKVSAYRSLLGGAARGNQTRLDTMVYTGHLQRQLAKPTARHGTQLNRVVRFLKKHSVPLLFRRVGGPYRIVAVSDSSFKAEESTGLAVKGGVILLTIEGSGLGGRVMVLEWISTRQSHVCPSTYAAELHTALDVAALAHTIRLAVYEVFHGATSAADLLQNLTTVQQAVPLDLALDAKAVFDATAAREGKLPSEKALILHQLAFKQMVSNRLI